MDIDEILNDLNNQIETLEEERDRLVELQEESRRLAARVNAWFALHGSELPEVPAE